MGFWDTQAGADTGTAIQELAKATNRSKATKYETEMHIKTFVFKYDFSLDTGGIAEADKKLDAFIKDKLVIDIKVNRLDEEHIAYVVMYKYPPSK